MRIWKAYADFIQNYILVIIVTIFLAFVGMAIFGYFRNGELTGKYDVATLWVGIGTIFTSGVVAFLKFFIDSKYNTALGEHPQSGLTLVFKGEQDDTTQMRATSSTRPTADEK